MTVARLGYEIDSSGAVVAADNLDDMAAAAKRAEAGSKGLTGGVGKAGKALGGVSFNARMLVPQLSQIGQQFTATGQLGQAVAVQAADIGLAFGVVGTVIGTVAGVALPSLIDALSSTSEGADELARAMKSIEENTRSAKLELQAMQLGLENIEQVILSNEIAALERQRELLQSNLNSMPEAVRRNNELVIKGIDEQIKAKQELLDDDIKASENLAEQTNLIESANMFLEAQQRIRNENGAEMARQVKLEQQLTDEIGAGAVEALKLAGVDLSNLDDAARRAAALASSMGVAYGEAYALANVTFAPSGGGLTPDMPDLLPPASTPDPGRVGGGGGSRVDEFARDLEALRTSLRTEQEVVDEWYSEQQELLSERRAMEILGIEGHNEAKLRLEQEYQERLGEINKSSTGGNLGVLQDFFGEAEGLMQSGNDKLFKIGQAAAIANAVVNGHSAAVAAWEKGMQSGGPPLAAAFTALSLARTGAQIAAIKSASSGSSGGAGSGTSAGVTATGTAQPAPARQDAVIQLEGALADVLAPLMDNIVSELQSRSEDGVNIVGVTAR